MVSRSYPLTINEELLTVVAIGGGRVILLEFGERVCLETESLEKGSFETGK